MNAKRACLVALLITLAGAGAARAQPYGSGAPTAPAVVQPAALPAPGAQPGAVDAPVPPPTGPRLSDYILGTRPDCCGPLGADGPISTELYVRTGPSVVLQSGFFGHTLTTGWDVEGGGRVFFFNPTGDAAWVADFGLSNVNNHGQHSDMKAFLSLLVADQLGTASHHPFAVSVRSLNRTFVNFALGREWYLWAPGANCPGCGHMGDAPNLRAGVDVGGRWGSAKLELHEINHRTEAITGAFLALHTDLEIPCGGWVFVVGGRMEWDNTWMHTLLQDTPENLQNLNFLVNLGLRY